MADTPHSSLADSQLHECKGAASATINTVPVSDGAGSTSWAQAPHRVIMSVTIDDISTADTVYLPAGLTGTIEKVYTSIDGAIATADATITTSINAVAMTNGAVTVGYSGSAAGDVSVATPTANNSITQGDTISIATDGASTNTVPVHIQLVVKVGYS